MPSGSALEWARLGVSLLGVSLTVWCSWDAFLDALAMFGVELRGRIPPLVPARWLAAIAPTDLARATDQRLFAAGSFQRSVSRLWVLVVQLILSSSALLDGSQGADWKLILHMSCVIALTISAFTDRLERELFTRRHGPHHADSC